MRQSADLAWVLDGYNVLFQTPLAVAGTRGHIDLESSRRRLIGFLVELSRHRGPPPTAVVFDSKQSRSVIPQVSKAAPSLWVIFASHVDEADPYIEELIATHRRPRSLTVVTGDRKIRSTARTYGSPCLDPAEWYEASLRRLNSADLRWISRGGQPGPIEESPGRAAELPPKPQIGPLDWPGMRRRASRSLPDDPFDDLGEFELNR